MHREYNEDLFEHTKMTFGEHLEELRTSLVKACCALVIGVLVGLLFANHVVDYVQTPLKDALEDVLHAARRREAVSTSTCRNKRERHARARGFGSGREVVRRARAGSRKSDFVDPRRARRVLKALRPRPIDESALPKPVAGSSCSTSDDLIPFRTYHRVEDDPRVRIVGLRMEEPFVVYMKAGARCRRDRGQPVRVLLHLAVHRGRPVSARAKVRAHLSAVQHRACSWPGRRWRSSSSSASCWRSCSRSTIGCSIDPDARISDWLTFVLILPLGFGISFQLPLVMLFLERIGIFTVETYLSNWRISVLVICFIAMVLTPSDPYSMMLMADAARGAVLLRRPALQMDAAANHAVWRSDGLVAALGWS